MNAELKIELPGLDEVVDREIKFVTEDCQRIEAEFRATTDALAVNAAEQQRLIARLRALKADQATQQTKAETLKRILTARRRVLFEMEQEVA